MLWLQELHYSDLMEIGTKEFLDKTLKPPKSKDTNETAKDNEEPEPEDPEVEF